MSEFGQTKGIGVQSVHVPDGTFEDYEVKRALAIGINTYQHWPKLRAAIRSSRAIGEVLQDDYGFSVGFAEDVPLKDLVRLVSKSGPKAGEGGKSLFVLIFSGHGDESGCIIPADGDPAPRPEAGKPREIPETWVNYHDLCWRLSQLRYAHYLILLDCCHSGVITATKGAGALPMVDASLVRIQFDRAAAVITAGAEDEEVYDSGPDGLSYFASAVRDALRTHLTSGHATLTPSLAAYVQARVIETGHATPCYADRHLPSLDGTGRIVIYRRGFRVATTTLPSGTILRPYSAELRAAEGTPPYQWSAMGLPPGFALDAAAGRIAGTPTQAGSFAPHIEVADRAGRRASRDLSLVVQAVVDGAAEPLRLLSDALPAAIAGEPYSAELTCRGGTPPYRWSAAPLPAGLQIADTGQESAEIRGVAHNPCVEHIRLSVTDAAGATGELLWPVPLAVVRGEDYRKVAAGEYRLGYHSTPARDAKLNALAKQYYKFPTPDYCRRFYPERAVRLRAFLVKKTPVTNREYLDFVRASMRQERPTHWTADEATGHIPAGREAHPVVCVSYSDAAAWCAWRGSRLLTAAEWEAAASGGDGRLFPWGDDFEPTMCNAVEAKQGNTRAVNLPPPCECPFGLVDMAGNVAEWTDSGEVETDSESTATVYRTVRGGSFARMGQLFGMCFMESHEAFPTEVLVAPGQAGFGLHEPREDWLGFRDALDLEVEPPPEQRLANVQGGRPKGSNIAVGPFSMSRFAVSNLEYYEFLRATGHPQPSHWSASQPPFPYAQRHWPVVHVSQADARAFCEWKSTQLGRWCSLPTATHWELAVSGKAGRKYPWGDTYEAWRCNSRESGWGRPVDVFDLPEGNSPEGIYNLCGNVFEWLNSSDDTRGGSWRWKETCEYWGQGQANLPNRNETDTDTGFRYISTYVR